MTAAGVDHLSDDDFRLPEEVEALARIDEIPVPEAVRLAVSEHVAARRGDDEFEARLGRMIDEDREILEKLASS
jgi:hypothetical protein